MTYKPVVEIFEEIVALVRAEYDPIDLEEPYYMYGHPLEIVNILSLKTESDTLKSNRFPVIALFQDFKERVKPDHRELPALNLAIITDTDSTFLAAERYSTTFNPILYPLWVLLIKYMEASIYIDGSDFEYDKIDRLYWGKKGLYGKK